MGHILGAGDLKRLNDGHMIFLPQGVDIGFVLLDQHGVGAVVIELLNVLRGFDAAFRHKQHLSEIIALAKSAGDVPCAIGFGISTPEQAKEMAKLADGVIVGSAIVKLIAQSGRDSVTVVYDYVKSMKQAVLES